MSVGTASTLPREFTTVIPYVNIGTELPGEMKFFLHETDKLNEGVKTFTVAFKTVALDTDSITYDIEITFINDECTQSFQKPTPTMQ